MDLNMGLNMKFNMDNIVYYYRIQFLPIHVCGHTFAVTLFCDHKTLAANIKSL